MRAKFPHIIIGLALSLLMALVLGTDNHNLAVSFNYLAFVAHRLYRRSDFHFTFLRLIFVFLLCCNKASISAQAVKGLGCGARPRLRGRT